MRHIAVNIFALILSVIQISVSAATFSTDDLGISITMTGEITPGDGESLAGIFLGIKPIGNFYLYPNTLYLNSPGGDVSEAIRIADLVKTLGLSVATAPNGMGVCASSCFLVYVAAIQRNATGIDILQTNGPKGNLGPLGVHRPFFKVPIAGPTGSAQQEQLMTEMRAYLIKSGVSHYIIDKMMSHASNDIYWLNAGDIRALGPFSPGVEEQLISACGYNAKREASLSVRDYIRSSQSGVLACVRDYYGKTYQPLLYAAVDKMRNGWRPWR